MPPIIELIVLKSSLNTEFQVVDEATLKRKVSVPVSGVGPLTGAVTSSPNPTASISMDNVNLSDSSELPGSGTRFTRGKQFANGDCIVTMLPVNTKLPWVSPARFRPELVPEELMSPSLTVRLDCSTRRLLIFVTLSV